MSEDTTTFEIEWTSFADAMERLRGSLEAWQQLLHDAGFESIEEMEQARRRDIYVYRKRERKRRARLGM